MKIPKTEMIKNSMKDMKHKYLYVGFPHNLSSKSGHSGEQKGCY